jgi:hypothetical protein
MSFGVPIHFQRRNGFPFYCARCSGLFTGPEALIGCLRAPEELDGGSSRAVGPSLS